MAEQRIADLSALIDSTEDFIWSVDLNFGLLTFNAPVRQYYETNFGKRAALGMRPEDLLPPERAALWYKRYERALKEDSFQVESQRADGRTTRLTFHRIVSDSGVEGISVFGKDITEWKAAEKARQNAETKYKDIFVGALEGMFQTSAEGRILSANPALARILGYSSVEELLRHVSDVGQQVWVDPDERLTFLQKTKEQGALLGFECRLKHKDGSILFASVSSRFIPANSEQGEHYDGFITDITANKRAEQEIRESADFLSQAQINGDLGFYVLDISSGVWTSTDVLDRLLGIDENYERTVAGWLALVHPEDQEVMAAHAANEVVRDGKPFDKEYRIIRKVDGAELWVHGMGTLEFDSQGKPQKMRGIIRNITDRKRSEVLLRESEERYRSTFEQAAVGMLHTSLDGRIVRCNEYFAEMIGYRVDEIPGMTFQQITAPADQAGSAEVLKRMNASAASISGPSVWEKRYIRKNGSLTWVRLTVSIQRDIGGRPIHYITVAQDINARKKAEANLDALQEELKASEERYRTTFQMSLDVVNINRLSDGLYVDVNQAFLDLVGFERGEVIGKTSCELGIWANPDDRKRLLHELRLNSTCHNLEAKFRKKNGAEFWGSMSASLIEIDGTRCILSVSRDISETKAAEERLANAAEALRATEERYRTVFQTCFDGILINRLDSGQCIDVNQMFLSALGFERDEVIGKSPLELGIWVDLNERDKFLEILRRDSSCHAFEAHFRRKDGEILWGRVSATITQIDGTPCLISVTQDISEAKAAEGEIRNLVYYDQLTRLPNRRMLLDRLRQSLAIGARSGRKRALLFIDLDNFKDLNDSLGHQTGDLMLQEVACRISACVRDSDTVARLGGDEFVVLLEDLSLSAEEAAAQAKVVGEKLVVAVNEPFWLDERECFSTSSIGITVFGEKVESTSEVLQQADIAMYQAKNAGRNTICFFEPSLQNAVNARAAMEEELRQAIRKKEFVLYYQPQVNSMCIKGAEALIRWRHPKRGILAPGEFISLAEQTGLILPLGEWILEDVCNQLVAWASREETSRLVIAVNISARQFRQPNFVDQVVNTLRRTGANPENLRMELTESLLVDDIEGVVEKMTTLKSHGLRFSLDDFGTGYSSLSYLRHLPLDQLKIDRSFVKDILTDSTSGAIAQTIISLGAAMNLPVMAEGVETEAQRDYLANHGCHAFQGYLFSRPLTLDGFALFLEQFQGTQPVGALASTT